jgi:hypothetical protein
VEDNTRMMLSDSPADRLEASRRLNALISYEQTRQGILDLPDEVVTRLDGALSRGKADPVPEVRRNCEQAWAALHETTARTDELP